MDDCNCKKKLSNKWPSDNDISGDDLIRSILEEDEIEEIKTNINNNIISLMNKIKKNKKKITHSMVNNNDNYNDEDKNVNLTSFILTDKHKLCLNEQENCIIKDDENNKKCGEIELLDLFENNYRYCIEDKIEENMATDKKKSTLIDKKKIQSLLKKLDSLR